MMVAGWISRVWERFQAAGSGDTTPPLQLQPGEDKSFPPAPCSGSLAFSQRPTLSW